MSSHWNFNDILRTMIPTYENDFSPKLIYSEWNIVLRFSGFKIPKNPLFFPCRQTKENNISLIARTKSDEYLSIVLIDARIHTLKWQQTISSQKKSNWYYIHFQYLITLKYIYSKEKTRFIEHIIIGSLSNRISRLHRPLNEQELTKILNI